jgi:peptidoglycan/xylan/chitin deacetylase (PgdA/CDA1 family)
MTRTLCERAALATVPRRPPSTSGRILCYHSVGTPEWGVNDVSPRRFRRQLELALSLGFRFVSADLVASGDALATDLAVTFDDALLSVLHNGAPVMAELGVPWTLFVVTDWARGRHSFGGGLLMGWSQIRELARAGVEIGSHSVTHPNFGQIEAPEARAELFGSRQTLADQLGTAPDAFAIPFGQSRDWKHEAMLIARSAGYRRVYAQAAATRPPGTIGRTFITRFDSDRLFVAALRGAFDAWEESY